MAPWLTSPRVGLALVASIYLLSFPYHPGLRSPNELCRLWQSRAIVDHGTLVLNQTLRDFGPVGDLSCAAVVEAPRGTLAENLGGPVFEARGDSLLRYLRPCRAPAEKGERVVEERYYPSKAPLMSFLGVPVYWVLRQVADGGPVTDVAQVLWSRFFFTVLPTFALLWMLGRELRQVSPAWTDPLLVVYALGTMALSYSQAYMSHQPTAVLLFGTFFASRRAAAGEWGSWGWAVAGACAGAAVAAEYTAALTVLCLAAWVVATQWRRWGALARAAALVVAGAVPFLAMLLWYHASAYGSPFESGYRWLNDVGYQHWHVGGFLGIGAPRASWLVLSFFSPLRGLFALAPFLLLAFIGVGPLRARGGGLAGLAALLFAANAYFTSAFDYSSWGWTVGPRHLTPLVPFLMLPVAAGLERLSCSGGGGAWAGARGAAAGLLVSSVAVVTAVSFVNYVPDSASTALFGLVLPLLREGFWPVTWLPAVGIPNPFSGGLLVALAAAAVAWLVVAVVRRGAAPWAMIAAILVHQGALVAATRDDEGDRGARQLLKSVWLAPSGARIELFPPRVDR